MIYYIILFLIIAISSLINMFVNKKKLRCLYILCIIYLIIFSGFRDGIGGYDLNNYSYFFHQIKPINEIGTLTELTSYRFEILYTLLNSSIKFFTENYRVVFLICSIISISCISKFNYKYSPYPFFSMLYFLYKLFIYGNLVAVRQSVAIGLFLISIKYIEENKFYKYLIINIIGSCFHSSALILIPFFFIRKIDFKKVNLIKLISFTLLMMVISSPLLKIFAYISRYILPMNISNKIYSYTYSVYFTNASLLNIVEAVGIVALLYIFYKEDRNNIIIKGSYINFMLVVAFIFFSFMARVNLYFGYFYMISVAYIIKGIKNKNLKLLIYMMLLFIFLFGFIYDIKTFDLGSMQNYSNWLINSLIC